MARNRRRIVDNMSDNIEEDDATQRREPDAVDAVEDEDLQNQTRQARSAVSRSGQRGESSKKAAAAQSGVANERDDDDADADAEDATPVFDADSFGNKPLSRPDGQKLQGMASDWNMIETHLKESAFSLLTEVSAAVAEYADDSTARKVTTLRLHACILPCSLFVFRN
jgi:E3 SUMO-protein ligase NSE2